MVCCFALQYAICALRVFCFIEKAKQKARPAAFSPMPPPCSLRRNGWLLCCGLNCMYRCPPRPPHSRRDQKGNSPLATVRQREGRKETATQKPPPRHSRRKWPANANREDTGRKTEGTEGIMPRLFTLPRSCGIIEKKRRSPRTKRLCPPRTRGHRCAGRNRPLQ